MIDDLWQFVVGIVSQWQALVTGSLLTALLFAFERWTNTQLSRRAVVVVFVWVYLGLATFLSWRDERLRYRELEARTSDAQPLSMDQEARLKAVLSKGKGEGLIVGSFSNDKAGRAFADRIRNAFSASGWSVGSGGGSSAGSGRSLRILSDEPNHPSVNLVMTAFNEANLHYRLLRVCQNTRLAVEIGEPDAPR